MSGTSPDPRRPSPDQRSGTGSGAAEEPPPGAATLCLGDARVDIICEQPVDDVAQGDAFVPHLGGAVATTAVTAARYGAHIALAGGAGDDAWGRWLRARLEREGVDVARFELVAGVATPLAVVAVDRAGEPTWHIYGDAVPRVAHALDDSVEDAIHGAAAMFISSNTLVDTEERELTMRAREAAQTLGRPVVFAPGVRLDTWRSRADAAAAANACVPDSMLVCASAGEAALMTGEGDPERAAVALLKAGARMVVITLGPEGAMLRGELRMDVPGHSANVLSTLGAGNVLAGILLARLATSGFYPAAVAASLQEAVAESARCCERWGALE